MKGDGGWPNGGSVENVLRRIRREIAESFRDTGEISDALLYERIDSAMVGLGRNFQLSLEERTRYRKELYDSFRGMGILQELLEDEAVTEIMVNGLEAVFIEKGNQIRLWERRFESREALEDVIQVMAARVNRIVNTASPIADLRLEDGSRVNIVLPPAAPEGPVMTIRKFYREALTMEDMIRQGAVSEQGAAFLAGAVRAGYNIFISGGTSSGKTTFLNALSAYIPSEERVITIEDSLELQLQGLPNLIRLETRDANLEGENQITIRDLLRTSLRMRPDRIIVGEVRGAETSDLLQVLNTGHRGSLSSGHGNSSRDMLSRLESMALTGMAELPLPAVRSQIASAIELIVHMGRLSDRQRRVLAIEEVTGYEDGQIQSHTLFRFQRGEGLLYTGEKIVRSGKWEEYYGSLPEISCGKDPQRPDPAGGDL